MDGAEVPKQLSSWGLLRTASRRICGGPWSDGCERTSVAVGRKSGPSSTKNNQLRTGADKGNPTV